MDHDRGKFDTIRRYLHQQFLGATVEDQHDFDRGAQTFKVLRDRGHYLAKFDEDFLDDQDLKALEDWLAASQLVETLRAAPKETVWVMSDGKLAVRPRN